MLAQWLSTAGPEVSLEQLAHTLNHHRGGTACSVACARGRAQAVAGLSALAAGSPHPAWWGRTRAHAGPGRCSSTRTGVAVGRDGRQLLADEPAFAAAVDELEPAFVERVGFSLRVSWRPLNRSWASTASNRCWSAQLALTALWRSYGVHPDAVIGHRWARSPPPWCPVR